MIGSPPLSNKTDHSKFASSPHSHTTSAHFDAPSIPAPINRTLPKLPNSSTSNSPSLSVRSSTNNTFYHESNQSAMVIQTDSASVKSDDSSSISDGHLHLSITNSPRINDNKSFIETSSSPNHKHHLNKPSGNAISSSTNSTNPTSAMPIPIDRAPSPSPSLISEREREENERVERELELKRKRLQIYVFICRCIACPFNAKQSSDMARKHLKINAVQYGVIKIGRAHV